MSPFAVNDISLKLNALFGNDASGAYVRSLLHIRAQTLSSWTKRMVQNRRFRCLGCQLRRQRGTSRHQIRKTYTLTVNPRVIKRYSTKLCLLFMFPVKKPGGYQYRVAIRDSQDGKAGSASQFIQVPNLKKGRLTSSSMLLDTLTKQEWDKLIDPNGDTVRSDTSLDTALRQVKIGNVLRYGLEVYNAKLNSARKPTAVANSRFL